MLYDRNGWLFFFFFFCIVVVTGARNTALVPEVHRIGFDQLDAVCNISMLYSSQCQAGQYVEPFLRIQPSTVCELGRFDLSPIYLYYHLINKQLNGQEKAYRSLTTCGMGPA